MVFLEKTHIKLEKSHSKLEKTHSKLGKKVEDIELNPDSNLEVTLTLTKSYPNTNLEVNLTLKGSYPNDSNLKPSTILTLNRLRTCSYA